jgi:hypothetical protein
VENGYSVGPGKVGASMNIQMERVVVYVPLPLLDWINILYFLQANGSFLCDSFVNKLADKNPMQSLIASRHSSFFDKNWIAFLTKIIFKQVSPFNFMKSSHLKNKPRPQRISLFLGFRTQGPAIPLSGKLKASTMASV